MAAAPLPTIIVIVPATAPPSAPETGATPGALTRSQPLRIWTHLFHNAADVDNLITKLQLTVPRL